MLALTILSAFNINPRRGHLRRAVHLWGYLKKYSNPSTKLDEQDPEFNIGWLEKNIIIIPQTAVPVPGKLPRDDDDWGFLKPLLKPLLVTTIFDASWVHNLVTRHIITGVLIYVRTVVTAKSVY